MQAVVLINKMAAVVLSLATVALVARAVWTGIEILGDTDGGDTPRLKRRLGRTLAAAAVLVSLTGLIMAIARYYGYTTSW